MTNGLEIPAASKGAHIKTFVIYALVGGSTALLELLLFHIQHAFFGVDVVVANIVAVVVATLANFLLNRGVSFKGASNIWASILFYLLLFVFNTTFSTKVIYFLSVMGFHATLIKVATMACIVGWNYLLYRFIVFPPDSYRSEFMARAGERPQSKIVHWFAEKGIGVRHAVFVLVLISLLIALILL